MAASTTKRKGNESEEDTKGAPLLRKRRKVSQGPEQLVEPSKNAAKDKEPVNVEGEGN